MNNQPVAITLEQVEILRTTVARNLTIDQLKVFVGLCLRQGLDPYKKQAHPVMRWDSNSRQEIMTIQPSVDGLRAIAVKSGEYEGQVGPYWMGADEVWKDYWVAKEPPIAAKVGVWRKGFKEPTWGFARFDAYCVKGKDGKLSKFWAQMAELMIAKVAESLALRKAFPNEVGGQYSKEEMEQADPVDRIEQKAALPAPPIEEEKPEEDIPDFRDLDLVSVLKRRMNFAKTEAALRAAYADFIGALKKGDIAGITEDDIVALKDARKAELGL